MIKPILTAQTTFFSQNPSIKISYLGRNFTEWFKDKTEDDVKSTLTSFDLTSYSEDAEIISKIGSEQKAEVSLSEVWHLLEAQATGESGQLLTNGYVNIFYVRDIKLVLRTVFVGWDGSGWYVGAGALGGSGWYVGGRIFSRNSLSSEPLAPKSSDPLTLEPLERIAIALEKIADRFVNANKTIKRKK